MLRPENSIVPMYLRNENVSGTGPLGLHLCQPGRQTAELFPTLGILGKTECLAQQSPGANYLIIGDNHL